MDEFAALNTAAIAVAQEDKDLANHGKLLKNFNDDKGFEIVADLGRTATTDYDRVTTYLIDKEGVVRQVFPNLIHHRASWDAALAEVRRITGVSEADSTGGEFDSAGGEFDSAGGETDTGGGS